MYISGKTNGYDGPEIGGYEGVSVESGKLDYGLGDAGYARTYSSLANKTGNVDGYRQDVGNSYPEVVAVERAYGVSTNSLEDRFSNYMLGHYRSLQDIFSNKEKKSCPTCKRMF